MPACVAMKMAVARWIASHDEAADSGSPTPTCTEYVRHILFTDHRSASKKK